MKTRLILLTIFMLLADARIHAAQAPNVLLIITDEHNFRTLGCYRETLPREQAEMWGFDAVVKTPHLDRIAGEGVLCTRAYATSPVCSPCRAAMITGRYPHTAGVPANDRVLDQSIPTLADRLNKAGYRSTFIGKWHLGGTGKPEWAPKVDGGFQSTEYMFNRGHWKKFEVADGKPRIAARSKNGQPSYGVDNADPSTFSTDWLTNRAIEFVTAKGVQKPFFAVVSYPDPHGPNTVRTPYDTQFDDLPFKAPRTYRANAPTPKWVGKVKRHPVFRGADMSKYFGMVKCLDDNIGRLLQRLQASGRLDNTLIIMTSDHGDLCYEHDRQNKGNPYEGSARVPMILRLPGRIAPRQFYTQPMGTVDLTPTVMGLLRLPADKADQGRDLSAALADPSAIEGQKKTVTFLRNAGTTANWVAAIDDRYKLILSVQDEPWLFDNEEDPDELENRLDRAENHDVVRKLAMALKSYGRSTKDPHLEADEIAQSLAKILKE